MRIGTRGSPLALAQANMVRDQLIAAHADLGEGDIELVVIKTSGDRITDRPLADLGGKGLFTLELEQGLADGALDIAVHSMKDMPTALPADLAVSCVLPREDPRDGFLSPKAASLSDLPAGAVVGTASLRRQAQVLKLRPDLKVMNFRGNVQTRLQKLADGEVDATLLAVAGLKRLGLEDRVTAAVETDAMLPAVAQGVIGVESRADDEAVAARLAALHHEETFLAMAAERAFLSALDGSCRTPIAALATLDGTGQDGQLSLRGQILRPDGSESLETTREGPAVDGAALGADAGAELRAKAGPDFFGKAE